MNWILWAYNITTWQLGIVIIGATVLVACLGLVSTRRFVARHFKVANEVVFCIFGATGLIYGLVLGLLAIATWESLKGAEETAHHEAAQVQKLDRDLEIYGGQDAAKLRELLKSYLETVIRVEWPQQRAGRKIWASAPIDELTRSWIRLQPTEQQRPVHAEALAQLNLLFSYRLARIEAVNIALPASFWMVVLLGAAFNIWLTYLISNVTLKTHVVLTGIFAATIGLVIFVIFAVDHPMWGDVSVKPDSYKEVLHGMESENAP